MARLLGATCSALLLVLGVSTGATAERTAHAAARVPPAGLLTDLKDIDGLLTKLIADERNGNGLDARELGRRINTIHRSKFALVREFFGQSVYGVKFSEVFTSLDTLDYELALGLGEGLGGGLVTNERIAKTFELGQKSKERLENELRAAANAPAGLLTDLKDLDHLLTNLVADERKCNGLDARELGRRINTIHRNKFALVREFFGQSVYGVKFSEVFTSLDTLDYELALGLGEGLGGGLVTNERIAKTFELGQKSKERLEAELRAARNKSHHYHHAKHTKPYRKGPPCRAGTFTSQALGVATPPVTSEYWFDTPIPNAAYYDHKHGYRSGGCDQPNGKVKVNIAVHGADGSSISWRYDYPPYPTAPPPDNQPRAIHQGDYCPKDITQPTSTASCRVYPPQLAFPLPSQGYSGPPLTTDASKYRTYAVNVELQNNFADAGGTAASIYVTVTWTPATGTVP